MDQYKNRLRKLFEKGDVDAIVLSKSSQQNSNFMYMTGLEGDLFDGSLLILTEGRIVLLASVLEDKAAMGRVSNSITVRRFLNGKEAWSIVKRYTDGRRVGFDGSSLPFSTYERLRKLSAARKMVDASGIFDEARSVKDDAEIRNIRRAVRIVKRAIEGAREGFKPGVTEIDISDRLDALIREQDSANSFKTIVCFGKNSAIPHHVSDRTRLRPNSLVLIDAGAKYMGYCSDITRTFIFRPDKSSLKYRRMLDMYDTVEGAQRLALRAARNGAYGDSVHSAAEKCIDTYNGGIYKGKFIHGLGHSIGLDVHDSASWALAPRCHMRIKEGMVFSDEPGIYIGGFGGVRIEDDILITSKGAVML